ncbi:MAG: Uma2 family endonuclease [Candidatus Binatia bacterium]
METDSSAGPYTADSYFALVEEGLLSPDDRVELLEGIVVAMPPQAPLHAAGVRRVHRALQAALGAETLISVQAPLVAGASSVPEPDVCVLAGREVDYVARHPARALLVVEVAESSLAQDRLTKSRIYAHAQVPDFWIVNLRDRVVEWYGDPDSVARIYRRKGTAKGTDRLALAAFPDAILTAIELLPRS